MHQRIMLYQRKYIFRRTCIYKQPILTKQWNYIYRLLHVFFLLLVPILLELHENQRRKNCNRKKGHRRICVKDITFLAAYSPSYVIFCRFFRVLFPSSQVTCRMAALKIHNMYNKIDRVMSAIENKKKICRFTLKMYNAFSSKFPHFLPLLIIS